MPKKNIIKNLVIKLFACGRKRIFSVFILFAAFSIALSGDLVNAGCSGGCGLDPNDPRITSNGERIFLTGMSRENDKMVKVKFKLELPDDFFSGGSEHKKKVESGVMPCLRCHNFYGTGGVAFEYEGRQVKSANLANIGQMHFTLRDLEKAVSNGIGMDKRKLVPFMPRFDFTPGQLEDIKGFIEKLPERLNSLRTEQKKKEKSLAF